MPRLRISLKRHSAVRVDRLSHGRKTLVYVLLADKKIAYMDGRSKVVYIGTTKNGMDRIAQSVAARSDAIFALRGVLEFNAHIVTCTPRQSIKTWHKLERALLLEFRNLYGETPECNGTGHQMAETDEFEYFSRSRVRRILEDLA
jgi:hypothetical protein